MIGFQDFITQDCIQHAAEVLAKPRLASEMANHNYELGHLMASQLRKCLTEEAGGIVDRPPAGRWLVERIFSPGASLDWRTLVEKATGEVLNPRYFVESFEF